MNPLSFLSGLISPITELIKGKQKIKAAKTEAKIATRAALVESKVKSIERGEVSDIEMDNIARQQAGWMDDVSFFAFLLPAILSFYPPALPHIKAGFVALELMPQWYQAALGMMLISVWGYRKLLGPIIQSLAKAYLGKLPR